jgi:hypothetical protein
MPVNISRGMLKRMEERNIKWEEIDETMGLQELADAEGKEGPRQPRDIRGNLRTTYGSKAYVYKEQYKQSRA